LFFQAQEMRKRNRVKQTTPLEERLLQAAEALRAKARNLEPGENREALLKKARQFEGQVAMSILFVAPQKSGDTSPDGL
jgi:hypothetical protein